MKTQIIILCSLAFVLATGCGTPKLKAKPTIAGIVRTGEGAGKLAKGRFRLPQNYEQDRAFRKMKLFSSYSRGSVAADSKQVSQDELANVSTFLQAKMGYIKRFEVWARHNDGGFVMASELADIGEVELKGQDIEPAGLDLVQSARPVLAKTIEQLSGGQVHIHYAVTLIVEIKDANHKQIGRPLTYVGNAKATGFIDINTGRITAGQTGKEEGVIIQAACMDALKRYMGGIANEFPVSGKITGIARLDSNRMQMDKGVEQGLGEGTQLCIWIRDAGVAFPLAYATAEPGENKSSLVVWRWNDQNEAVKALVNEIKSPGWIGKPGNEIFATSVGMPFPPEWGGE